MKAAPSQTSLKIKIKTIPKQARITSPLQVPAKDRMPQAVKAGLKSMLEIQRAKEATLTTREACYKKIGNIVSNRKDLHQTSEDLFSDSNTIFMIADKKNNRSKIAQQTKEESTTKSKDEFDTKRKVIRDKMRTKRVNYVVKDLPIY